MKVKKRISIDPQSLACVIKRSLVNGMILGLIAVVSTQCSVKPEDPGLCKLNCSQAIIGGNDLPLSIKMKTQPVSYTCPTTSAGQPLGDPLFVQFVIAEAYDSGGGNTSDRPVPNISIEPLINGARSDRPADNPNVEINGDVFTPARYKGIITPKDNWCSDACGVVTLEVAAVCPPAGEQGEVGIQVHTGALYSDLATFGLQTQSP